MQQFLFNQEIYGQFQESIPEIPGLIFIPDYLTPEEENYYMNCADQGIWQDTLKRRVQHYGFRYDYSFKTSLKKAPPFPGWAKILAGRVSETLRGYTETDSVFKQMIVNEYKPGQGIGAHVDRTEHFGEPLVVISLGSDTGYRFILPDYSDVRDVTGLSDQALTAFRQGYLVEEKKFTLPRRSLVAMTKDARYLWMHEMPARKSDVVAGIRAGRSRRISITYRTVV